MSRTQLLQCKRYFNSDGKVRTFLCGWFKNKVNKCYSGGGKIAFFNFFVKRIGHFSDWMVYIIRGHHCVYKSGKLMVCNLRDC